MERAEEKWQEIRLRVFATHLFKENESWFCTAVFHFCFKAMIKQFLTDVYWGDIDYLIIDTPPGTSDEHITVVENVRAHNPDGAILVTTPQVNVQFSVGTDS